MIKESAMDTHSQKTVQKIKNKLGALGFDIQEHSSICRGAHGLGFQVYFHEPKKQLMVSIFVISNSEREGSVLHRTNFPSLLLSIWPQWQDSDYLDRAATSPMILDKQARVYGEAFERFIALKISGQDLLHQILFIENDPQYLES